MISNTKKEIPVNKKTIPVITFGLLLFGSILFWRGVWNLIDTYFLPNNFLISNIICIVLAIIITFTIAVLYNHKITLI